MEMKNIWLVGWRVVHFRCPDGSRGPAWPVIGLKDKEEAARVCTSSLSTCRSGRKRYVDSVAPAFVY